MYRKKREVLSAGEEASAVTAAAFSMDGGSLQRA